MRHRRVILGTLAVLFAAPPIAAQEGATNTEIALEYLATLYAFDFDSLGDLLAVDAVFRDPTASVLAGAEVAYQGRDAIVAGFEAGAAGSRNASYEIVRQFATGDHVVFSLVFRAELAGDAVGVPGAWIPVEVSAVTVLQIAHGRVVEHLDHVDYEALLRQVAADPGNS